MLRPQEFEIAMSALGQDLIVSDFFNFSRVSNPVFFYSGRINHLVVFFDDFLHIADYGSEGGEADSHAFLLCGRTGFALGFGGIDFFYYSININIIVVHIDLITLQ